MKIYLFILSLFFCSITYSQTSISGSVKDSKNQPIPGANVKVAGESAGTVTDSDGKFTLTTAKKPPFDIEVSNVGYGASKVSVTSDNQTVSVSLKEQETQLDEIVVAASRVPEKVRESPVTIERMTIRDIKKTASPTFYDGLENLKEVQMNTSSMSFKSINTRGFATIANTRFMQLVDGMDNASPLLNFVLGNLIGVSDIDVSSVELLPGASSALYGANAFNGILFMNSKSPFKYPGITAYAKYGSTSQKSAGSNDYRDYGVRVAHAFSKHFAAKANFTYMKGTEWHATDYEDKTIEGRDRSHHNYNGINVYGDEVSTNIKGVGRALVGLGLLPAAALNILPNESVSRTGYNEVDLTDNKVRNAKVDFSMHLRPFGNENLEVVWQSKFGFGNSVYQGANRYYLNGFSMQQHKLELTGKNFFVRGYYTTEDGGSSYDMLFTGININRAWKPDATWFGQYAGAYVQSTLAGATPDQAHAGARVVADNGRLLPGTPEFQNAFNQVTSDPNVLTGSKLVDNSKIYHSDANYNFKDLIKFAEIQMGGSYRRYDLNSFGRIYTDTPEFGGIKYDEYGAYTQVQKKLMNDRLKFTGSVRYDKSENFDGNYSPRVSLVFNAGKARNHIFRGSFQTGFRNPTTQDQYIGFNVGNAILLGSAPDNLTRYVETLPVTSPLGQALVGGTTTTINGNNAYYNSYTLQSVTAFAALAPTNPIAASALLVRTDVDLVKPETVKAIELGYRGEMNGIGFDINGYYNVYNDFIGNLTVVAPLYGTAQDAPNPLLGPTNPGAQSIDALATGNTRAFQLYTNSDTEVSSIGLGIGINYKTPGNFEFSANYNYAEFGGGLSLSKIKQGNFFNNTGNSLLPALQSDESGFEAGFNTPKHRAKASFGNEKLFKNFGFNISGRWSAEYYWESSFDDGLIDAATVIDAQISYCLPGLKSVVKAGATNIGGKEYRQLIGPGLIGQQYFLSLTINP